MTGDDFDLPGVPFDSYSWGGVAIHGAYWHNDYGRPRSHGCVSVPSEVAKWVFRWPMDGGGPRWHRSKTGLQTRAVISRWPNSATGWRGWNGRSTKNDLWN